MKDICPANRKYRGGIRSLGLRTSVANPAEQMQLIAKEENEK